MKPKNEIYCQDCGRPKMLFESEKKAMNFIKFNGEAVYNDTKVRLCRAYYCQYCGGWHVTSNPNPIKISKTNRAIDAFNKSEAARKKMEEELVKKKAREEQLKREKRREAEERKRLEKMLVNAKQEQIKNKTLKKLEHKIEVIKSTIENKHFKCAKILLKVALIEFNKLPFTSDKRRKKIIDTLIVLRSKLEDYLCLNSIKKF